MEQFETVYQINMYRGIFIAMGISILMIATPLIFFFLFFYFGRNHYIFGRGYIRFLMGIAMLIAFLTLAFAVFCIFPDVWDISTAYEKRKYSVTEGIVKVVNKQLKGGSVRGDIIEIGGERFEIDSFVMTPAYRQPIINGGVLKNGVYARVYHYKHSILRIDIKPPESENETDSHENEQ